MSEIKDSLKKIVMAGFGAVNVGLEKSQQVLDQLAEKGKDTYDQAVEATRAAADKIKQALNADDPGIRVDDVLTVLGCMPLDALKEIRTKLDQLILELETKKEAGCGEEPCEDACCEEACPQEEDPAIHNDEKPNDSNDMPQL